jgi:ABC-type multidrug transport system fused ATPase/permease subunit
MDSSQDHFVFKSTGSGDENIPVHGDEFQRIVTFYNHQWIAILAAIMSILGGVAPLCMTWVIADSFQNVLNPDGFLKGMQQMLVYWAILAIATSAIMGGSFLLRGYENPGFVQNLRDALFRSIMEKDMSYFDKTSAGVLISRLSEDVVFCLETYADKLNNCVQYVSQICGGIIIAATVSWRVTLIVIGVVPIAVVIYFMGEYMVNQLWLEFRDCSKSTATQAEEVITAFRTVKSFDSELFESETYARGLTDVHDIVIRASHVHAIKNCIMSFLSMGMIAPIMYYSGYLAYKKPYLGAELGDLIVLGVCLQNAATGVSQCISSIDDLRKAAISAAKLLVILDEKPSEDRHAGNTLPEVHGKIEFRNVAFKYETRDDYAVKDLSFTINAGETVALVGESGCGKTTTLQLLQKFYQIESGEILIDDVDIQTLSSVFVRSQLAIVPQGPVLFSMSIMDNIRLGREGSTKHEATAAAQIGNAHDFIMELADNYETPVRQMSLSGGQKQRICISRAILANTPVLLLDEATAALDTESEQLVQQALENYRHGKTAVIVAHRLATVKNADRILVFHEGKVAEQGTHDELLQRSGIYADLIKFQLQ